MRAHPVIIFALLLVLPFSAFASWLQLDKSGGGYLFKGIAEGENFSFEVPGTSVQTSGDSGRAFVKIDEVLVQIMRAPLPTAPDEKALDAHRASEIAYLEKAGAKIEPSNICVGLAVPHEEWRAIMANGATSTYLTVRLQHHVLLIVVSQETASAGADSKLASACQSFVA